MEVAKIILKSKDGRNYLADPVWGGRVALMLKILVALAILPLFDPDLFGPFCAPDLDFDGQGLRPLTGR